VNKIYKSHNAGCLLSCHQYGMTLSSWWDFTLCLITKFIYIANIVHLVT